MGQLFGQGLTVPNSAITDPSTGQTSIGKPNDVLNATAGPIAARAKAQEQANVLGGPNQAQPLPNISTPSLTQAATAGALPGSANVLSPGLNKAGKLAVLLTSGLQGALAGRAANEQATVASGGRRSGGAGMGFEAGYQLPWQRAGLQQQYEQEQAKTNLLRAQADMVPTQFGPMPAALARYILPSQLRAGATEQAAQTRAGAELGSAQIGAQSRTGAAQIGADARIRAAQLGLGPIAQVPQDLQQQFGLPAELPLRMLNQAESAANKPLTIVGGENDQFVVNKQTQEKAPLGVGNRAVGAAMARPVQIGDPNNPGNTTFTTAGNAIKTGAAGPQSASVQVPRAVAKSATSGPIANQITAFNTALQHADLLQQALGALNNGDVRTLNSLKNRFKTEFGSPDVTNLQAISNAYSREITKMLSAGHMTDAEIGSAGATMPTNASPQQMLGALQAYRTLATSKMQQLQGQVNAGMQGRPNFPANLGIQEGATATGPNGHKIRFTQGAWKDATTGQPIQQSAQ